MKRHTTTVRVWYADTDRMGVVYYANHLRYFEIGRTEYLRAAGSSYREMEERGVRLPVSEASCHYLGPAGYEDVLEIESWVDRLRPTRIDFRHEIRLAADATPVARGHVVLACVDEAGRPRRLPEDLVSVIEVCNGDGPGK